MLACTRRASYVNDDSLNLQSKTNMYYFDKQFIFYTFLNGIKVLPCVNKIKILKVISSQYADLFDDITYIPGIHPPI